MKRSQVREIVLNILIECVFIGLVCTSFMLPKFAGAKNGDSQSIQAPRCALKTNSAALK